MRELRMVTWCVWRFSGFALFVALTAMLIGCSGGGGSGSGGSAPKGDSVAAYRAGDYAGALAAAEAEAQGTTGAARERAALMAGLSNYALKRADEATTWLLPLIESEDPKIAGTAAWTLGSIAYDKGNYPKAITLLATAKPKLKGDDAAKALALEGDCHARLNKPAEARAAYAEAAALATDESLRASLTSRAGGVIPVPLGGGPSTIPPGTRYVIQLGAFGNRASAEKLAANSSAAVVRAGQGRPRVVQRSDRATGQGVFAVRVGDYGSRQAAEAVLGQLGVQGTVMADLP
ncbi:MAG: SPOR domain-containing protein [Phycisphaerales bacterium]